MVKNRMRSIREDLGKRIGKSPAEIASLEEKSKKLMAAVSAVSAAKRQQHQQKSGPDEEPKASTSGMSAGPARRKVKTVPTKVEKEDEDSDDENEKGGEGEEDEDEDDEEAIRQMKADSKVLKEMNKYKKGKKKNITTFRQRNQTEKLARNKKFTTRVTVTEKGDTGGRYFGTKHKAGGAKNGTANNNNRTSSSSSPSFKQRSNQNQGGRAKGKKFTTSVPLSEIKGGKGFKPKNKR